MACKLTVIDLTQDAGDDSQTLKTTLHRFIAIEQDFAEDFALQAVGEIEVSAMSDYGSILINLTSQEIMARPESRTLRFSGHS